MKSEKLLERLYKSRRNYIRDKAVSSENTKVGQGSHTRVDWINKNIEYIDDIVKAIKERDELKKELDRIRGIGERLPEDINFMLNKIYILENTKGAVSKQVRVDLMKLKTRITDVHHALYRKES